MNYDEKQPRDYGGVIVGAFYLLLAVAWLVNLWKLFYCEDTSRWDAIIHMIGVFSGLGAVITCWK